MELENRIGHVNQRLTGGITPAMATPISRENEGVALDVVPQLVGFLINSGVRGLFVGGTTGEGILIDIDQRKALHEAAVATAADRVPVLLHVGALATASAVELSRHAAVIGAVAIVAVTPVFYGIHDDALVAYYQAIARAAPEIPLFAYDIPHMAVNGISPRLAERLFAEIPSFAGLKSSNPDAQAVRRLLDVVPENRIMLVGNESIALGSLAMGAAGMISGLSTAVPEPFVVMASAFAAGDIAAARRQQKLINRLLAEVPAGVRIGAIKGILEARGIPVGPPIAPLPEVTPGIWARMEDILAT